MASRVRPGQRRRWPWVLVLLLLVMPTVEIAVIIGVGRVIGAWPTLVLLVVESALGAWLVKREGSRTWTSLSAALRSGRMPSRELADAALVLIGGTLLLTPGFVTDLVGFLFLLPLTRPLARRWLEVAVTKRLLSGVVATSSPRRPGFGPTPPGPVAPGEVVPGEVIDPGST